MRDFEIKLELDKIKKTFSEAPFEALQMLPKDVVEKATHLMAKITHAQPFEDGNRRTGIISTMQFLRDNGYELEIESGQANLDIRKMLKEIKMHMSGLHKETLEQISFYISKRIVSL